MTVRLILAALAALALSGCQAMGCGAAANGHNEAGACTAHVPF
jgi:hypothetical protein